jgi:hypothetical protein
MYHCTVDLQFDWFGISCMTTDNFCFYLQNRLILTSQAGGEWYSGTSPFSIPWLNWSLEKAVSSQGLKSSHSCLISIILKSLTFFEKKWAQKNFATPCSGSCFWCSFPGINVIKLFFFVSNTLGKKNQINSFIPNQSKLCKLGGQPYSAPLGKASTLFSDKEKRFIKLTPGVNVFKLFFFITNTL